MAKYCRLSPVVQKRDGVKVKEVDSRLFHDIKDVVNDREQAWKMWAFTKTSEFKDKYKDKVQYDELGEPTFQSFIKALGLTEAYNQDKGITQVSRDYNLSQTVQNAGSAADKINDFNSKEKRFVAISHKEADGYHLQAFPRSAANVEAARQQSYNHALTGEILGLLRSMGFDVSFASNPRYDGIFDPANATLHDGLITVISIAKGEVGEDALPEEFSHLIIEGLQAHPLVQRLLSSLSDEQIHEILADSYDSYYQQYDGDAMKMKKEAAGKLLAQFITGQGNISQPVLRPKRSLLSRIWNWAKNIFQRITNRQLSDARDRAYNSVAGIYNLVATGAAVPVIDKNSILSADTLYKLRKEFDTLEKVGHHGEYITAKILQMERNNGTNTRKTTQTLQKIRDLNESDQTFESVITFLNDTKQRIEAIAADMRRAERNGASGTMTDIRLIGQVARIDRKISTFVDGYKSVLSAMATFDEDDNIAQLGLADEESGKLIADTANACLKVINKLVEWRDTVSRNILYNSCRTVYKDDKVRGIGSRRNEIMSLDTILDHAERDINYVDRWLSAMSDADDSLLSLMDSIVKNQQYERDMEMIDINARIAAADKKLRSAGFSADFMYERDADGVPTGRIISIYDWDAYNADLKNEIQRLRQWQKDNDKTDAEYRKRLRQWKNGTDGHHNPRLVKVYVNPDIDADYREHGDKAVPDDAVYELMPNPKVYSKNAERINSLSEAQQEYYNTMMDIKRRMMKKIPHRGQAIFRAVFISKDFIEGIIDNTTGNPLKATFENFKKQFLRRPDDIGFGTSENFLETIRGILSKEKDSYKAAEQIIQALADDIDEDVIAVLSPKKMRRIIDKNIGERTNESINATVEAITEMIQSENFYIVDTDFADHRIQKLPIYYTRRLHDMRNLSTDFSGTMVAYSAMATNYEKMNEVVDILEVGREYINNRDVLENMGNKPIMTQFNALGKAYKRLVTKAGNGTNIAGRMDDYMASVVYEERKEDEGTKTIFGINFDTAKTLDTIKDYTGLIGLGFNVFSAISNVTVGKLQQWIESFAGEYFTLKDYAKAVTQYAELMPGCFAEIASPVKKNKLSLLIQMFDPMADYFESLRDPNYNKSHLSRILGSGALAYIGMNGGEHLLHCQTMLAMLNNVKLNDASTGKKISLYDALQVKKAGGITKLVLKDGLSYERDLIDNSGNAKSNKHFGRPVLDENGKIKTEAVQLKDISDNTTQKYLLRQKRRIRKVNDSLNGAFGVNDKGAIHRKSWGRLLIQFRQWMPAHYMRRFARAHYDSDLEQWREGYYVTVVKTLNSMWKDLKHGEMQFLKYKDQLSNHEKANLRRALSEVSMFFMLLLLCRLGGRVKDKDRSWLDKMFLYQIHRMYLETGASMPFNGGFFSNIFQLLQSPAASINTFEAVSKVIQFWNMFDEIQTGRYQGWTEWERDAFKLIPAADQLLKAYYFDDSMFTMFDQ